MARVKDNLEKTPSTSRVDDVVSKLKVALPKRNAYVLPESVPNLKIATACATPNAEILILM